MSSYVYFMKPIGMDGPIKIGCSIVPEKRLEDLSVWSPFPLEVIATAPGRHKLEHALHDRFAYLHSHREWFHAGPELISAINKIASGVPVEDAVDLSRTTGSIRAKIKRKPWSAERRRFMRWIVRTHAALRRAERRAGCELWMPEGVWSLVYRMRESAFEPTVNDIATLEEFISNPFDHSQTREQRWPRKEAA